MGFYKLLAFLIALTVMLTPLLSLKRTRPEGAENPEGLSSVADEQSDENPKDKDKVKRDRG